METDDLRSRVNGKMHIVQELVPGKEITLAHIIAHPDPIIYKKMGLDPTVDFQGAAIGILTMSPSEVSVIAGDIAIKSANIDLGFLDRFSGTTIFTGKVSEVEMAMKAVVQYFKNSLKFDVCGVTTT